MPQHSVVKEGQSASVAYAEKALQSDSNLKIWPLTFSVIPLVQYVQ